MVPKSPRQTVPVYSSEQGRLCPDCGFPVAACTCRRQPVAPRSDGIVRVGRQTKGRKGSGVTTVSGLPLTLDQLRDLAARLKKQCGAGGGVKDGVIEIQGDHRDLLVAALGRLGYTVKRAGG
jgi:translation initiation factor 1